MASTSAASKAAASARSSSAVLGSAYACYVLGVSFERGEYGLPKDPKETRRWYRKAQVCALTIFTVLRKAAKQHRLSLADVRLSDYLLISVTHILPRRGNEHKGNVGASPGSVGSLWLAHLLYKDQGPRTKDLLDSQVERAAKLRADSAIAELREQHGRELRDQGLTSRKRVYDSI